jgi:hypothetical protein
MSRSRYQQEDGVSLIMVLVFIMVFSLVIGAILDFALTGFKTSEAISDVRDQQHAIDGAVDGAINAIRRSNSAGFTGSTTGCPTFEYDAPSGSSDPDVTVKCTAVGTLTGSANETVPEYAVLVLGTTGSDGFTRSGSASKTLTIDGGLFSNRTIGSGSGNIAVFGDALAVSTCSPLNGSGVPTGISGTGSVKCALGNSYLEADPGYAPQIANTSTLTVDPTPSCQSSQSIIKFDPGLYSEDPANLIPGTCSGKVWWFSPGTYYFNFNSTGLWTIPGSGVNAIKIVGGKLKAGWSASTLASAITFPDACDPGTEAAPETGVQFIFGGDTVISTSGPNGKIELCAGQSGVTDKQRIAVYGLGGVGNTHTRTQQGTSGSPKVMKATTAASTSTPPFLLPDNAKSIDSLNSTAVLGKNQTATLKLTNFSTAGLSGFEGAKILSAKLRVNHTFGSRITTRRVTVKTSATNTDVYNNPASGTAFDILSNLETSYRWRQIRDIEVTYDAIHNSNNGSGAAADTANLDGIVLEITYLAAGFQSHACSGTCDLLTVGGNGFAVFHGTFYTPTASLNVKVHNGQPGDGEVAFERGLIARSVVADTINSSKQTSAPFQLPGLTNRRVVLFEAYLNSDGNPGTSPGASDLRLRAKVQFDDSDGLPGRNVKVLDWAVIR